MKTAASPSYEHRAKPLASHRVYLTRLARSALTALALVIVSLSIGMLGYHLTEGLSWVDSFLNAAMILSGMGEVDPLRTTAGKIFAGVYAIFSGLALITIAGIMLAPAVHRFLHRLHLEQ